ncbi:keratin, type II cytoskeletal 1-like [Teleopsis dalmanni]|uniref:keratin, type II cytoskeletal 1-like n=1 Tax=Teleopsis dalmanni TaxID=139649 RepID=UPI0018CF0274|nr:keratin, type II cytoskeletal 1-like [Teleopsis dalmanni]
MFKLLPIAIALLAISGTYAELRLLTKTRLTAPATILPTITNTVLDDEMTSGGGGSAGSANGLGGAVGTSGSGSAVGASGSGSAVGASGAGSAGKAVGASGAGRAVGTSGSGSAVGASGAGSAAAAPAPAPITRSRILLTTTKLAPSIRHHILPAQAIPLPLTISTRPGLRTVIAPETITIQQAGIAKVGEVVQKIPTAVSHQSQTIVHKHADVVTPIVAPAVRTITSQVVKTYHTPLVYAPEPSFVRFLKH